MVRPQDIVTYADWDLVTQQRRRIAQHRTTDGSSNPATLAHHHPLWPRQERTWVTSLRIATRADILRLRQIWTDTRRFALPVAFTPPPPEDSEGQIPVLVGSKELAYVLQNAVLGQFEVSVIEYPG